MFFHVGKNVSISGPKSTSGERDIIIESGARGHLWVQGPDPTGGAEIWSSSGVLTAKYAKYLKNRVIRMSYIR